MKNVVELLIGPPFNATHAPKINSVWGFHLLLLDMKYVFHASVEKAIVRRRSFESIVSYLLGVPFVQLTVIIYLFIC